MSFARLVALVALSSSSTALATPPAAHGCGPQATLAAGQTSIDDGDYADAIRVFSCVLQANPLAVDAYRGRAEAELMIGRYADAFHEYALLIAAVQPPDIDALAAQVLGSYDARLASPDEATLTGASFARWVFWEYRAAIPLLDQLLADDPNNVYATLFRGSNRAFGGKHVSQGLQDLDHAVALAPNSADVRYVVADAFTYAYPDFDRAFDEATLALDLGLDTPRVHAILATILNDRGELAEAAEHVQIHIDQVTTQTVATTPLAVGATKTLALWPGRTHEIPVYAVAGSTIAIETGSPSDQIWDSIAVLLDPAGTPVVSADDTIWYFAAFDWTAPTTGTYKLRVTSFEAINTGPLTVTRD